MSQRSRTPRAVRLCWLVCGCWLGMASACGGVAEEQHAPPAANAGATALADAGMVELDAESNDDASTDSDAGAMETCPSDAVFCCDSWTGLRSPPSCINGYTQCGEHQDAQIVDSECLRTPDVCHVESLTELEGKACSSGGLTCPFGRGCSSCSCECQESTLLWVCQCTAC